MTRIILLIGFLACDDGRDVTGSRPTRDGLSAALTLSARIPTVAFVRWTSPEGATLEWVEYGLDGVLDRTTPPRDAGADEPHPVLGLKAGRTYAWRAVSARADGTRVESPIQTVEVAPVPHGVPRFTLRQPAGPASSLPGHLVMVSVIAPEGSWVQILDSDADVVWYYPAHPGTMIVTSKFSRFGSDVLFAEYDMGQALDVGRVIRVSLDGRAVTETRTVLAHHDFVEHADGTLAWLGYAYDPTGANVVSDVIRAIPEGATDADSPVEVFSWFEDVDYGVWDICAHTAEWNADPTYREWTHSNSLMVDDTEEHYYLQSKYQDTLVKIERASGRVVWQMNGLHGDFTSADSGANPWTGVGHTELWSHAHMSHLWDGGMVVFDNGYHYPDGNVSRAAEFVYDEARRTVAKVWEYAEPDGKFTPLMGDVRKLGENYVIAWSSLGRIDEVTATHEVPWQVSLALGAVTGRISIVQDLYAVP